MLSLTLMNGEFSKQNVNNVALNASKVDLCNFR